MKYNNQYSYESIIYEMRSINPGYNSMTDDEIEKQLDAIFSCGYEWQQTDRKIGFYNPKTNLYLKINGLQYYSPESIIQTYEDVWSKDSSERRDRFKKYPETQVGCLFILSFSLFFIVELNIAIAVISSLFLILYLFGRWNKKIRDDEYEYDLKISKERKQKKRIKI